MRNFHSTGVYADIVQHVFFMLTVCWRVRYHWSLLEFENILGYKFKVSSRIRAISGLNLESSTSRIGPYSSIEFNQLRHKQRPREKLSEKLWSSRYPKQE